MLDETPSSASRGAALCQSPRRRGRGLGTPVATPAITPQASPERRGQGDAHPQREYGWPRAKGTPAMISVSGSQYRADRGHQFTVGNVSNGLIYLRYDLPNINRGTHHITDCLATQRVFDTASRRDF